MHVVTGATGHIGVNLVRALSLAGKPVRALVRGEPPPGLFDGMDIEYRRLDLLDPSTMATAMQGAEVVYHLAGIISITGDQDGLVERVNVEGTRLVAEAALSAGARRLVHVSSIQAYDVLADVPEITEDSPRPGPDAPAYDRSKASSEVVVRRVIDGGLDAVIVNPTGVLGPIDHRPSRLGQALLDLRDGKVPALLSGGLNVVDVRDVAQSIAAAADQGRSGEGYILGGHHRSIPKLMRTAAGICGVESPGLVCPMWVARMSAPLTLGWARLMKREPLYTAEALRALRANPRISHAKAAAELGHAPRPLEQTLRDLFSSFQALGV
jgi:dihydroflavonol-4-reductase